jgi:excisionase family DNA binding protein
VKKPEPEPPILITRREAARLMSVTERHLQNLERDGVFKPVRLGASVRYRRAEVDAVIARLANGDAR